MPPQEPHRKNGLRVSERTVDQGRGGGGGSGREVGLVGLPSHLSGDWAIFLGVFWPLSVFFGLKHK